MIYRGAATTVLVESLLICGAEADMREAAAAIERLAAAPTDPGFVLHDVPLLRLRALLARAHGDEVSFSRFAESYRALSTSCGFAGHMQMAEALT